MSAFTTPPPASSIKYSSSGRVPTTSLAPQPERHRACGKRALRERPAAPLAARCRRPSVNRGRGLWFPACFRQLLAVARIGVVSSDSAVSRQAGEPGPFRKGMTGRRPAGSFAGWVGEAAVTAFVADVPCHLLRSRTPCAAFDVMEPVPGGRCVVGCGRRPVSRGNVTVPVRQAQRQAKGRQGSRAQRGGLAAGR